MKKSGSIALLVLLFVFPCKFMFAQEVNVGIIEGFKNGNASLIAEYLTPEVDYMGPNKESQLSADQTKSQLTSLFASLKVSSFEVKHNGKSPSGNAYLIGSMTTSKGVYRVYLLFPEKTKEKISEIRIEKDE
ncbi:MAG TPA: hypothetical protein DCX54_05050 [Flavobacteriales bacterium]|nr:hypothetical protein [Flavobacteriales bacterium]